jgi:hypothetical protein
MFLADNAPLSPSLISRPKFEVADILNRYESAYREEYGVTPLQAKVMNAIKVCRTVALGGHMDVCTDCGALAKPSYNSCRNRHCPKCQGLDQLRWLEAREQDLLPIQYFHVVFTLPHDINDLIPYNEKLIYSLLFKSAAETLQSFADRQWNGQLGLISVLHTWSQSLMRHTHLHLIVTGGVLTHDQQRWIQCPKNYLFPVKGLAKTFKAIYLKHLLKAHKNNELIIPSDDPRYFDHLERELRFKKWIMYCKAPFSDATHVVRYIARYTHKVAISNQRILTIDNDQVTFSYRNGKKQDTMTVSAVEFIRRFLQHVLPKGFTRIRYYGLLAGCQRNKKLARCREIMELPPRTNKPREPYDALLLRLLGIDIHKCSSCGGSLIPFFDITKAGDYLPTGPPIA